VADGGDSRGAEAAAGDVGVAVPGIPSGTHAPARSAAADRTAAHPRGLISRRSP
jgi:hypothetical protein